MTALQGFTRAPPLLRRASAPQGLRGGGSRDARLTASTAPHSLIAFQKTNGQLLQAHYEQVDWRLLQQQRSLTLAVLVSKRPRAHLSIFDNFNTLCGECDFPTTADDAPAPALLLCSFCNFSFHNSTECLGKTGGEIIVAHFVQNEAREWTCPRCWKDTLSKARHSVKRPATAVGGGRYAHTAVAPNQTRS